MWNHSFERPISLSKKYSKFCNIVLIKILWSGSISIFERNNFYRSDSNGRERHLKITHSADWIYSVSHMQTDTRMYDVIILCPSLENRKIPWPAQWQCKKNQFADILPLLIMPHWKINPTKVSSMIQQHWYRAMCF